MDTAALTSRSASRDAPEELSGARRGGRDESTKVSRCERPAKPVLTRELIVDAAFAIVRSAEAPKLTLRLLAQRLDTGPASLSVYIRNTTDINAMLIGRFIQDMDLHWLPEDEPWRSRLYRLMRDYTVLLTAYPQIASAALVVWPDGPHYLDLVELVMRLLGSAGVPDTAAARATDVLLQHATVSAVEWGERAHQGEQNLHDLAATLESADRRRHPIITRVGVDTFLGGSTFERGTWVIDALLDGLLNTPTATPPEPREDI